MFVQCIALSQMSSQPQMGAVKLKDESNGSFNDIL